VLLFGDAGRTKSELNVTNSDKGDAEAHTVGILRGVFQKYNPLRGTIPMNGS
jgi:hypothetical protein